MKKAHGQLRRGQLLTTYGPGALFDLPRHSAIVGGLDSWPHTNLLEEIVELRLSRTLQKMTSVVLPKLYAPPTSDDAPGAKPLGVTVYRFPEWFVVQEHILPGTRTRSRRLVKRPALDSKGQIEGRAVVATRFVAACVHGHIDDVNWRFFVHGATHCHQQMWLDEQGTSGDLGDLFVRCECGKRRNMIDAANRSLRPLGTCSGRRPWLGQQSTDACGEQARLLIRTASNAYFPQVVTLLSLPERDTSVDTIVQELWDDLSVVEDAADLKSFKKKPANAQKLAGFSDDEILAAIARRHTGVMQDKPLKQVELDAILAAPVGYGEDVPLDETFHVRQLPESVWRHSATSASLAAVYQLHRLREVMALVGFTRFEAITADINGEYDTDVERAPLANEPRWFPAVENRGEGIFVQVRAEAIEAWQARPAVQARLTALLKGHEQWQTKRKTQSPFPGGPYILLHTLSHMLLQSLALRCGYPMSAIRERIYADSTGGRYGILLYTGSPDSGGTLGGLVQQARAIEDHLQHALGAAQLCSNDPICAQHTADDQLDVRWLLGAACHGCSLIGESSCEMRNDYLDRALVVPVLGHENAAFFPQATPGAATL